MGQRLGGTVQFQQNIAAMKLRLRNAGIDLQRRKQFFQRLFMAALLGQQQPQHVPGREGERIARHHLPVKLLGFRQPPAAMKGRRLIVKLFQVHPAMVSTPEGSFNPAS